MYPKTGTLNSCHALYLNWFDAYTFFLFHLSSIASAGQLEDSIFDQWSIVDGILGFCPAGILVSEMGTSSAFRTVEPLTLPHIGYFEQLQP